MAQLLSDPVRLLSLVEQGTISGVNFLALMVLARGLEKAEFGLFSFAYLAFLFIVNLHRALVVVPFVLHTSQPLELAREGRAWGWLNAFVAVLAAGLMAGVALLTEPFGGPDWMRQAFFAAAIFVIPGFHYEFLRRWAIQAGAYRWAVGAAIAYGIVFLGGCFVAASVQSLDLALAAFVAASLTAWGLCLIAARRCKSQPLAMPLLQFLKELRPFLGWSLLTNVAYNGYGHVPGLLIAPLAGPVAMAVFQAMRVLNQPIMTLATAIDNFDKPRAARALATDGPAGMRRQIFRTTLATVLMAAPYMIFLLSAGDWLIHSLYGGKYAGQESILAWWVAISMASLAAYPFETALYVLKRPDLLTRSRLAAALIAMITAFVAIPRFGVEGAMMAMFGGTAVAGLIGALTLNRMTKWQNPRIP